MAWVSVQMLFAWALISRRVKEPDQVEFHGIFSSAAQILFCQYLFQQFCAYLVVFCEFYSEVPNFLWANKTSQAA